MLFLFAMLYQLELAGKRLDARLRELREVLRSQRPTGGWQMSSGEKYTAAAYLVVFVGVLAYVLIIAAKLQRLEREVGELVELARERERGRCLSCSSGLR